MQSCLQKKNFFLHEAALFSDKEFNHKNETRASPDYHKKYMSKVLIYLVKPIRSGQTNVPTDRRTKGQTDGQQKNYVPTALAVDNEIMIHVSTCCK